MTRILSLLAAVLATACISAAPIVPVTPENSAAIGACQNTATTHNDLVIAGVVVSGSATGLASAGAGLTSSNPAASKDVAIVAAALGGVAVVDAILTGYSTSQFASSNCSTLVGPLPVVPAKPKDAGAPPSDAGVDAPIVPGV